MSNCCNLPNPLFRDGVSQRQRQAPALSPSYVKVDERELADFLVFAYQLAQKLIYYNDQNQVDGDWLAFWQYSTPVWLALIGKTRPQEVKETYDQQLYSFLTNRSPATLALLLVTWTRLLTQIKDWYEKLEAYTPFKSILKGLVKTNLGEPLIQIWALEQAYVTQAGQGATEFNYQGFAVTFNLGINSAPVADFIPLEGTLLEARNKLDIIFQVLWQNYRRIIQLAPQYLSHSLEARRDHQPYLALYFAFLEVMQPALDDLNRMTQKHLNFFYRQVLRLPNRPAEPDRAHLIFELAKSQTEYKLQANTRFKAGKDTSGVERIYQLDEEIVVHKGQVTSLQGLFLDSQEIATGKMPQNIRGLFDSPVANSWDGEGQDFPKDQVVKAWLPFGDNRRNLVKLGIAIASDVLLLQEGKRTITLQLTLKENLANLDDTQLNLQQKFSDLSKTDLLELFKVNFSGEKSWFAAEINDIERQTSANPDTYLLTIEIILTADLSAVVPYSADVHGLLLETERPVLLLQLNTDKNSLIKNLSPYHFLRSLELTELSITTTVEQVRNLILQNDLAVIDPAKPFQPFGPQPVVGSTFYIGSQEILQKNLSSLKLAIEWEGLPSNGDLVQHYRGYYIDGESVDGKTTAPEYFSNFSAQVERLTKSIWSDKGLTETYELFDASGEAKELLDTGQTPLAGEEIDTLTDFNLQSSNGFLRFTLNQNLLHEKFTSKYALQVLASAKDFLNRKEYVNGAVYEVISGETPTITLKRYKLEDPFDTDKTFSKAAPVTLNEPYTPIIRSLALSYTAIASKQDCQLFHLHPFKGFESLETEKTTYLLPRFTDEGTLYIGLQDLEPPTALPLLFQVAEETANTDLARADVEWYYLKDNSWQQIQDHQIVSDTTKGLITSGIVNLAIPADISKVKTTILDPNLYWLKVSVPARSQAICHIMGLHTQAAAVTFNDQGNDPNHLAVPLAAGTISKLAIPQPQVKTVAQPYDSFGGQVQEQARHFYTRISEHLRHKGRAITIFDYERLVLEKFPQIYKVRCINHGQVDHSGQLQELMPGAVTLAVIPNLSQRRTTNDLEPKVNINLLEEIEDYLAQLSSPWVEIRAVNPEYERIRVKFQVQFQEPYQANFGYYRRQLEQEIISFLSPWTVDTGAEIHFGGKIYRSSILNFIEERTYVDYVLNFEMDIGEQFNLREATASTARSILVSVPFADNEDEGHIIKPRETHPPNQPIATGKLGYESVRKLKLKD